MKTLIHWAIVASAVGALPWGGHDAAAATTRDVDIVGFAFSPSAVTIQVGDSVRWTQQDSFVVHTSTSGAPPGTPNGLWDSGGLATGSAFTQLFSSAGSFPYYCTPHFTFMIGSVTVQGGAANQPPSVTITSP